MSFIVIHIPGGSAKLHAPLACFLRKPPLPPAFSQLTYQAQAAPPPCLPAWLAACLLASVPQGPFAVPCVLGGTDLASFTVVAMENEADPRCLLLALQCVEVRPCQHWQSTAVACPTPSSGWGAKLIGHHCTGPASPPQGSKACSFDTTRPMNPCPGALRHSVPPQCSPKHTAHVWAQTLRWLKPLHTP